MVFVKYALVCQYFNFVDFGLIIQCRLLVGVRGPGESGTADSCLSTIDVECATIAIFQDNMTYYATACIHIRRICACVRKVFVILFLLYSPQLR